MLDRRFATKERYRRIPHDWGEIFSFLAIHNFLYIMCFATQWYIYIYIWLALPFNVYVYIFIYLKRREVDYIFDLY